MVRLKNFMVPLEFVPELVVTQQTKHLPDEMTGIQKHIKCTKTHV